MKSESNMKKNGETIEKTITIQTDPLPDDFILPTSVTAEKDSLNNVLYFFTPSSKGYTCAYDVNGDVRWYLTNYALWDNARLENGHMLISTERLINSPYYMTGLYEIDLLGKIYVEYSLPGGYHHDYDELPNGNLLVASDNFDSGAGTVEDYVVELDRKTGNIVKTFDIKDVLPMDEGKSEIGVNMTGSTTTLFGTMKKQTPSLFLDRHQDAVINIDYDTKKLKLDSWRSDQLE